MRLPDQLFDQAEEAAEEKGYMNTSEYAREAIRKKVEADLVTVRDDEEMIPVEEAEEMLRKEAAVSKLESKVEEEGLPEKWPLALQEVYEEMIEEEIISEDTHIRKIYEYTHEKRTELEEEYRGENQ